MSFAPLSSRSVRDSRHNRFESYAEPAAHDRSQHWERKRQRWRAEQQQAGAGHSDAFATGGLFAGFGQRGAQQPRTQLTQPQHTAATQPATPARLDNRGQHSGAREDERSAAYRDRDRDRDRAGQRPQPALFPSITGHRLAPPQPAFPLQGWGVPSGQSPSPSPSSFMSGVHDLHGGPSADEQRQRRAAQQAYHATLQQQTAEKEARRQRDKAEAADRERREDEAARNYNPFGRGGGGAPMRDESGHIIANRTQALALALSPTHNSRHTAAHAAANSGHAQHAAQHQPQSQPHSQPYQAAAAATGYAQPVARGRVGLRSDDSDAAARRRDERAEWQQSLAAQIDEKAAKKRRDDERQREEDRREDERLHKERGRMEDEWRVERDREQIKQRAAQDEADSKARRAKADEGLTDYEREQAMKGRRVQPPPQQPQQAEQQQSQQRRAEERKEPFIAAAVSSQSASSGASQQRHSSPRSPRPHGPLPFSYDELERDMERLRAEIRQDGDKARERHGGKQQQPQRQTGGASEQAGYGRRRQRLAAADEDDDSNIARFLNKQRGSWQPADDHSARWQRQQDSGVAGVGYGEMDAEMELGSGAQLAGHSTFVPLPANYRSRLGTPEAQPPPRQQRHRVHDSAATVSQPPPPPRPPAAATVASNATAAVRLLADARPLPALASPHSAKQPAPAQQEAQPAVSDEEELLYADEEFVVEQPQQAEDSERYSDDELVAETETETESAAVDDGEAEEVDEQSDLHQPSEYSKVVSDVDVVDDLLSEFVTETDNNDTAQLPATRKRNGRKKWSARATAVQAAA